MPKTPAAPTTVRRPADPVTALHGPRATTCTDAVLAWAVRLACQPPQRVRWADGDGPEVAFHVYEALRRIQALALLGPLPDAPWFTEPLLALAGTDIRQRIVLPDDLSVGPAGVPTLAVAAVPDRILGDAVHQLTMRRLAQKAAAQILRTIPTLGDDALVVVLEAIPDEPAHVAGVLAHPGATPALARLALRRWADEPGVDDAALIPKAILHALPRWPEAADGLRARLVAALFPVRDTLTGGGRQVLAQALRGASAAAFPALWRAIARRDPGYAVPLLDRAAGSKVGRLTRQDALALLRQVEDPELRLAITRTLHKLGPGDAARTPARRGRPSR